MCTCMCMYVNVEVRSQHQVHQLFFYFFETGHFIEPHRFGYTDWPVSPRNPPVSAPESWGYRCVRQHLAFTQVLGS